MTMQADSYVAPSLWMVTPRSQRPSAEWRPMWSRCACAASTADAPDMPVCSALACALYQFLSCKSVNQKKYSKRALCGAV